MPVINLDVACRSGARLPPLRLRPVKHTPTQRAIGCVMSISRPIGASLFVLFRIDLNLDRPAQSHQPLERIWRFYCV